LDGSFHFTNNIYILSKYFSKDGTPSLSPFLFLVSVTIMYDEVGFVLSSMGSSGIICQWSNTHCGNAFP